MFVTSTQKIMAAQARGMDAPLNEKLNHVAGAVRSISPQFGEAVDQLVGRLQNNGAGATAPKPGDQMPTFLLPDETGQLISLRHSGEIIILAFAVWRSIGVNPLPVGPAAREDNFDKSRQAESEFGEPERYAWIAGWCPFIPAP
jgi:hypothetical protein